MRIRATDEFAVSAREPATEISHGRHVRIGQHGRRVGFDQRGRRLGIKRHGLRRLEDAGRLRRKRHHRSRDGKQHRRHHCLRSDQSFEIVRCLSVVEHLGTARYIGVVRRLGVARQPRRQSTRRWGRHHTRDGHTAQRPGLSAARSHDKTITVPYASVTDAELLSWSGSELPGAEQTFAVRIDTRAVRGSLIVQLDHGNRNRGSGHARHDRLVDLVRAHAAKTVNDAAVGEGGSTAGGDGPTAGGGEVTADASETVYCRECGEVMSRRAEACPACDVPNAAREAGDRGGHGQ